MKRIALKGAATVAALLFWVLLWHLVAEKVDLSLVLPAPLEVLERLGDLIRTAEFYEIMGTSLLRVTSGYLAGVFSGVLLGFLAFRIPLFKALVSPMMGVIRATPVASFILVVLLWIHRDGIPGFISFLMVLPIVWQNTLLGFERRDGRLSEMAKVFRFGKLKTLIRVDLPQVLPFVFSSAKAGMGLAWKAGVAAEVLALPKVSIGQMIYNSKMYLETVDLYAWTLAIILISVALEKLVFFLFSRKRGGISVEA
ncbi:MAG: ABC transporter permease subunit [Clostridia bacterium]|nr:ABC transporter permease subunit [Clostridia bacterium]